MNDFSKCKLNPSDEDFEDKMLDLHYDFTVKTGLKRISLEQLFTYIVLTYDIGSPYVTKYRDWAQRRREAARGANFTIRSGKYIPEAEEIILCENNVVNQMIIRYLFLQNDIDFIHLFSKQAMYFRQIRESLEKDYSQPGHYEKLKNNIDVLTKEIKTLQNSIFHGNETEELKKALYNFAGRISFDFKPEDIAQKKQDDEEIVDVSPYPDNYKPDKLTFNGDE